MAMSGQLKRILCVEDEPDVQPVLRLALQRVGQFEVLICGSGEEALVDGPAFAPDLLVFDVVMPGLDGPATLAKARSIPELANVPAVFVTGKTKPEDIAHYHTMGVIGVIPKPFDIKGLSAELQRIWDSAASS
ncbi:MAG: response regulator [Rhodospirillaceae bacterium]|nr:response regulator [Rhodospirillaceae bacterium]